MKYVKNMYAVNYKAKLGENKWRYIPGLWIRGLNIVRWHFSLS